MNQFIESHKVFALEKPTAYVAHFTDGSSGTLYNVRHSGSFFTGLAQRGDGFVRCLFFDRFGVSLEHDSWLAKPLEVIP